MEIAYDKETKPWRLQHHHRDISKAKSGVHCKTVAGRLHMIRKQVVNVATPTGQREIENLKKTIGACCNTITEWLHTIIMQVVQTATSLQGDGIW
jgi:hypothetical protein